MSESPDRMSSFPQKRALDEKSNAAFCVDISGSVCGSQFYWETVRTLLRQFLQEHPDGHIIGWDSNWEAVDAEGMSEWIAGRMGRGGTSPSRIVQALKHLNVDRNIWILTDGQVGQGDVDAAEMEMSYFRPIDHVKCHIIETSNCYMPGYASFGGGLGMGGMQPNAMGNINMSVSCPFTRANESLVVYHNSRLEVPRVEQQQSKADFAFLETLDKISLETFLQSYDKIEKLLISLNMGRAGNADAKDQLLNLRKRLMQELSSKGDTDLTSKIRAALKANDTTQATEIIKSMCDEYYGSSMGSEIERKISYLVSLCGDLRGIFSVGDIRSNRMRTAETVAAAPIETAPKLEEFGSDAATVTIECPIMLDVDVPVILLRDGPPILADLEKHVVDDIANCPLRLLNYAPVVEKLKARIAQFVGLELLKGDVTYNPFTREAIAGTISLGCDPQHVKVTNASLAKMFSGGKLLGNLDLYLAAVWYLVKHDHFEYLSEVKPAFDQLVEYRLTRSKTFASLSGQAQFVCTKVGTDVALWYVVHSGLLKLSPETDPARQHIFTMHIMRELLELLKYPILPEIITHHSRTKVLLNMLSFVKRDKVYFKRLIESLRQRAVMVANNQIILLDGEPNDELLSRFPPYYMDLPKNELYALGQMVDPQYSAQDLPLYYDWVAGDLPQPERSWSYPLDESVFVFPSVIVSPLTFRPVYVLAGEGETKMTWAQQADAFFAQMGGRVRLISGHRYFMECWIRNEAFPSKDDVLVYMFTKCCVNGTHKTLPSISLRLADYLIEGFTPLKEMAIPFEDIKQRFLLSTPVFPRIEAESGKEVKSKEKNRNSLDSSIRVQHNQDAKLSQRQQRRIERAHKRKSLKRDHRNRPPRRRQKIRRVQYF
eukprot:TRINITY_DN96_c0_g1_i8.p1 TRINITY_DN96_c0_g1~~TRINITY_DN96_c0_g1_i8.p1  ORF type:complete len:922 (+),score=191.53 TRINITY_DN96_c0_g1_i8:117-2768(+)